MCHYGAYRSDPEHPQDPQTTDDHHDGVDLAVVCMGLSENGEWGGHRNVLRSVSVYYGFGALGAASTI